MNTATDINQEIANEQFREECLDQLRAGTCSVNFVKKDGTEREMLCTLNMDKIPEKHIPKSDGNKRSTEGTISESIRAYDLEKEAWRSFRLDSVKTFSPSV